MRTDESESAEAPLRLTTLAAYGLPSLPTTILTFPLFVLLPTFYAQDLGLGLGLVGAILLGSRIWVAVSDPLVGVLSDHINTPWGRRRPWMVAGTPIALISLWFLLVPGEGVGGGYLLGWTIALYIGGTMILIPYNAWGAEISGHYHERARVTSFREIFVLAGGITGSGLAKRPRRGPPGHSTHCDRDTTDCRGVCGALCAGPPRRTRATPHICTGTCSGTKQQAVSAFGRGLFPQ